MSATTGSEPVKIGGEYWDAQLEVFDGLESGDYDLVVFRTGYGGGKTLLGSDWVHGVAVDVPRSDNLVIAPDSVKGKATTYKRFFDRLPGENTVPEEGGDPENSPVVEEYHGTDMRLTYGNGSIVRLGSADKWNRYAGGEFNAIYCDEPAHYDNTDLYDLHEMLISRQRTSGGPNVTLWTSTGAGYNQYYDITERMVQPDGSGGEEPLPWADYMTVIVGDSRDNPYHEEPEKLRRQFEGTAREEQALAGGFTAAQGLVYSTFSREHHILPHEEVADRVDGEWRIYGYDAGWDDPRVVLELGATAYDQFVVLDEYHESGTHVEDAIRWLREHDKFQGTIYAEHEPSDIQKFRGAGWHAVEAEKSIDSGISEVRRWMGTDDHGRVGLLVSDRCQHTIRELLSYKEEHVGTSTAEDHCADALRYAIFTNESGGGGHVPTATAEL